LNDTDLVPRTQNWREDCFDFRGTYNLHIVSSYASVSVLRLSDWNGYLFEDCDDLLLKCSLCEFGGDGKIREIVDSRDFSFLIGENPHERSIFIVKNDGVGDIEFKFELMVLIAGPEG
jgi:hypothetical protein